MLVWMFGFYDSKKHQYIHKTNTTNETFFSPRNRVIFSYLRNCRRGWLHIISHNNHYDNSLLEKKRDLLESKSLDNFQGNLF